MRQAESRPEHQEGSVEGHHRGDVEAAERDGRGADADAQIVVAVDHRVLGVVGEDPEQVAEQQPPGQRRHRAEPAGERRRVAAAHRRERHRDAEAEGDAEDGLRHREEALAERIDDRDGERDDAPGDGRCVGRQDERERGQGEHRAEQQGLAHADRAARHRARRGPLHVLVEVAVGDVVDGAAGAAHEEGAQHEDDDEMPAGEATGREPERGERRPEQQQRAGRAVPADQVEPEGEARARRAGHVEAVMAACICRPAQPSSCFWNTRPACSRSAWNLIFGQLASIARNSGAYSTSTVGASTAS